MPVSEAYQSSRYNNGNVKPVQTLLEELGRPSESRLLLVTCQGFGVSHAANQGVLNALRGGIGTSAGLAMACPWARAAAQSVSGEDVGVSLTLNAEYPAYRWGPLTQAPTLLDGDGGFPRTTEDLWEHADVTEVRRECQAQLERAMHWGIDVTHLGDHLDALTLRPEFFDVYLDLAEQFGLPIRLPGAALEARVAFPLRALADEAHILHADFVLRPRTRSQLLDGLATSPPGVTEVVLSPAVDTPELRAYAPDWAERLADAQLVAGNSDLALALQDFERIGYRMLRDCQRRL